MKYREPIHWLVFAALFVFPIVAVSVPHGASPSYIVLVLLGLVFGWPAIRSLTRAERGLIIALVVFFVIAALSLVNTENMPRGLNKLDRIIRYPLFIPAFLLVKRLDGVPARAVAWGSLPAAIVLCAYALFQVSVPTYPVRIDAEFQEFLTAGKIQDELRQALLEKNVNIPKRAVVARAGGAAWTISDGKRTYTVRPGENCLVIKKSLLWRAKGAYHEIVFGDFSMVLLAIVLAWTVTCAIGWPLRTAGVLCAMMAAYACLLSGSRGAWAALPIMGIFLMVIYARSLDRKALVCVSAGLVLGVLVLYVSAPEMVRMRLVDLKEVFSNPSRVASLRERCQLWKASLVMVRGSPLLGTGLGDFRTDLERLRDSGDVMLDRSYDHAHSIFFDALARTGIPGLLAMAVALFVIPFCIFFRRWTSRAPPWVRCMSLAGMLMTILFAVFGITEAWLSRMPLVLTHVTLTMSFLAGSSQENSQDVI